MMDEIRKMLSSVSGEIVEFFNSDPSTDLDRRNELKKRFCDLGKSVEEQAGKVAHSCSKTRLLIGKIGATISAISSILESSELCTKQSLIALLKKLDKHYYDLAKLVESPEVVRKRIEGNLNQPGDPRQICNKCRGGAVHPELKIYAKDLLMMPAKL